MLRWGVPFAIFFLIFMPRIEAQRTYAAHSVLASGSWYKIAVGEAGVYKMDLSTFSALGLNLSGSPVNSIRMYGNGGFMLPEACSAQVTDDLQEIALQVVDDGDGVFNGNDYLLFYASGPDQWVPDSVNQRFSHRKNLYESPSYYFITVGGVGKRISLQETQPAATKTVNTYSARYYHELDTVNFLASGKEWYGEEFTVAPGKSLNRNFNLTLPHVIATEKAIIVSNCISRSLANTSRFAVTVNNSALLNHDIARVGSTNLDIYALGSELSAVFSPAEALSLNYTYQPGGPGAQGWLNWFEIFYRADLLFSPGEQLFFRDWNSVANATAATYIVQGAAASSIVWDISDPSSPLQMRGAFSGSQYRFTNDCSRLHEYIAFNSGGFKTPLFLGKLPNQDLHGSAQADFLIVTTPELMAAAQELADFHRSRNNLKTRVLNVAEVYNEFASGSADPSALRNCLKMFYDRAGGDPAKAPRYLLLLGDASYDYKAAHKQTPDLIPAYESLSSLDPLTTFTSDDFYGFLDDSENINKNSGNSLDIGIGRIPARNLTDARNYLDKLKAYTDTASLGPWRNEITFVADDEDFNLHLHDAEAISASADTANADFHQNKVYLDAFPQESNISGSRYPAVNAAIKQGVEDGTLIWNYTGHGGFRRLAEEVVLDADLLAAWNNSRRLPLFITATCDFAPYDNPANFSLGENALLRPKTGAIALMTTTRLVFAFSNRIINSNYLRSALKKNPDGSYPSLGEAVRQAKNLVLTDASEALNNLKFTLLGDPALTLSFPKYRITTDEINGLATSGSDSLFALQSCMIKGSVKNNQGQLLNSFNGTVFTTVYDKVDSALTLANDPQSIAEKYPTQQRILFKGETEVKNGRFSLNFILPKDIDYKAGQGKLSFYATNGEEDANGTYKGLVIGGSSGISNDTKGPEINAYLNSETFKDGGTTGFKPLLVIRLTDSSGINITGSAIGHNITATIDDDAAQTLVLNSYFKPTLNTFREGYVRIQLPELAKGPHRLRIKAWDVANNSSEVSLQFIVTNEFTISNVSNFPNPFRGGTTIRLLNDLDAQNISVSIEIFTVAGLHVKSLNNTINTSGSRSIELIWDGKNDLGMPVRGGIYLFRVIVKTEKGVVKTKTGKLIKL